MIKHILYFGNPAYISQSLKQLHIKLKKEINGEIVEEHHQRPIEDIGIIVLDHPQITITNAAITELLNNNVAIVTCNKNYLPNGLLLPIEGHHIQTQRMRLQIEASEPLKKNLWKQTVQAKIINQANLLEQNNINASTLYAWSKKVKSGDPENREAHAAAWYWQRIFPHKPHFIREPKGEYPNNLLNYGYAILRATIARAIVATGLFPSFGIYHKNKYNPFCLADDLMEPYRPYVDKIVLHIYHKFPQKNELDKDVKKELLQIPHIDTIIENEKSPLMIAAQRTAISYVHCLSGEKRKLVFPILK